jgi:tRNA (cytidine56-2'-O)-methyltransferase
MVDRIVHVLRIGHRIVRDDRMTTHVCLVARAFGARKIYLYDADPRIETTIDDINHRWGGGFAVETVNEWRGLVKEWRRDGGVVTHLTMYGLDLDKAVGEICRLVGNILLVVGAEKVPRDLYDLSDFNVSIGHQPHSEVAAVAVFLDRLFQGEELKRVYTHSKCRVIPSRHGKQVEVTE